MISGILLVLLVRQYRRLTVDWMRASTLALVNRYGVARQQRDWDALPEPHPVSVPSTHPYAGDLDIVGNASLLQLLDTTGTTMGGERLAGWLLEPAAPNEIPPRQEAVRELSADLDWLQELQQRALLGEIDDEKTEQFLEWAQSPGTRLPLLTWLARLSVLFLIVMLALSIARVIDSGWLIVPFVANLLLATALHRKVGPRMDAAMDYGSAMRAYAALLELLDGKQRQAPLLQQIDAPLETDGVPASEAAQQLAKILSFGVPRGSLQSYMLQFACAWDVHFYDRLESWRGNVRRAGAAMAGSHRLVRSVGRARQSGARQSGLGLPEVSETNDRIDGQATRPSAHSRQSPRLQRCDRLVPRAPSSS